MKKTLLAASALLLAAGAHADITVKFPKGSESSYQYVTAPIGQSEEVTGTLSLDKDGVGKIADPAVPSRIFIPFADRRDQLNLYAAPGEKIVVDIQSVKPLSYTVKGSDLMEGIIDFTGTLTPLKKEYAEIAKAEPIDRAALEALENRADETIKKWMFDNRKSPAAVYALMSLGGQDYLDAFNALTSEAKESIIYPIAVEYKGEVEKSIAVERKRQEMQSGNYTAPDFTFRNIAGKDVSLSSFRGKWVVIDFWGSWCPWCIKGFPKLKEAYKQYAGKLEVIGLDCNDPEDAWRDAVKKYELPWVNLYNPEPRGGKTVTEYAVSGFPTKIIINPEGKIANITVGEDPAFFDTLARLMNGK